MHHRNNLLKVKYDIAHLIGKSFKLNVNLCHLRVTKQLQPKILKHYLFNISSSFSWSFHEDQAMFTSKSFSFFFFYFTSRFKIARNNRRWRYWFKPASGWSYLLFPINMMTMFDEECCRASSSQVVKWLKVSRLIKINFITEYKKNTLHKRKRIHHYLFNKMQNQ